MSKRIAIVFMLLPLFVVGCGEPRIDSSTDKSMKASIAKIRESLPQDKRAAFDKALQVIAFSQVDLKGLMTQGAPGVDATLGKVKDVLNGKTGLEVIAEAERVRKERKERERQKAVSEIKKLEERRAKAEGAKSELAKFKVIRSRFYKQKTQFMEKPVIELTVRNETAQPISRAYFKGTLASPNRAVAWLRETFNYKIPGGIEPGEKAAWKLSPNMFGSWGTVKAPKDAILTVEVEQLDSADGKPLFSARVFSEHDAMRLEKLKQEYGI